MATIRQKRLARAIVETANLDYPPTAGELLESVRYGKISKQPSRVMKSKGVLEELENLGFTVEGADNVVQKILYKGKKEETKLKAADILYKRLGAYEDTKQGAMKAVIFMPIEIMNKHGINATPSITEHSS